jgi:phage terminase large subunit-like protein
MGRLDWRLEGGRLIFKTTEDEVRPLPDDLMKRFINRRCWVGVDLSMTTDLSAVAFVFPFDDDGYDVLPFFWLPEGNVRKRELRDGMPYGQWINQGFMESCSGDVIDYRDVQARLEWGTEVFDVEEMCFDPWNSRQLSVTLIEAGHRCVEIRQGMQSLSEPSKKLLELVVSGKLHHGGHPVLRWNATCVMANEKNDNLMFTKPERSKNSSRIDGIAATVNALARALIAAPKQESVYESRGFLTL